MTEKSQVGEEHRIAPVLTDPLTPGVHPEPTVVEIDGVAGPMLGTKMKIRGPLARLLPSLLIGNLAMTLMWTAVPGVFIPLQVQGIDPAGKAAALGVILAVGAFAAAIAQPLIGTFSDRTRTRFGSRAPWLVGGALLGGVALIAIGSSNTLVAIGITYVAMQISYNAISNALTSIMPDRVPSAVRGTFSSLVGLGVMLGSVGGSAIAAQFATNLFAGYLLFAGLVLVVIVLFVLINPDKSNRDEERAPRLTFKTVISSYWVNPRKYPDFFWGFTGRFLLYGAFFLVTGFQLYILQDYIGLGDQAVAILPLLGLASLAGILVSTLAAGPISDKIGRRKPVVIIAALLCTSGLVFPLMMPNLTGWIIYTVLSGIGFGAYQAVDTALITEVLPGKSSFAKDIGVLGIAATLPQTLAPAIGGAIVSISGGYTWLFPIAIVIALFGALAVIPIKSVR